MISINSASFNNWTATVTCATEQNLNLSHQLNMNKCQNHLWVHLGEVWIQTAGGDNWKFVPLLSPHPLFTVTTRTLTLGKLMFYPLNYRYIKDWYILDNTNNKRTIHQLIPVDKGTSSHMHLIYSIVFLV